MKKTAQTMRSRLKPSSSRLNLSASDIVPSPLAGAKVARPSRRAKPLGQWLAGKPRRALGIQRIQGGPFEAGHVGLHGVADARLQISEVSVPLREAREQRG